MITLYHGSDVAVKLPLASAGRRSLDFGEGFYLTRLPDQSRKWAKAVSSRSPANKEGIVSIYEMDDTAFTEAGINYKYFEAYDLEWLDFVVACADKGATAPAMTSLKAEWPTTRSLILWRTMRTAASQSSRPLTSFVSRNRPIKSASAARISLTDTSASSE